MNTEARCGECENCRYVESTKKIVLAHSYPMSSTGIGDDMVDLWNFALKSSPCTGDKHVEDRDTIAQLRGQLAETETNLRRMREQISDYRMRVTRAEDLLSHAPQDAKRYRALRHWFHTVRAFNALFGVRSEIIFRAPEIRGFEQVFDRDQLDQLLDQHIKPPRER